ncbi:hypothetical protein L1049_025834 [Liquidambar formosana]|uniref:Rho GTPase-activating protein REN1-like n=1 Tax=Liquidambar formosana TaxID=63359 RepID=A0AAP0NBM3_LIQFO
MTTRNTDSSQGDGGIPPPPPRPPGPSDQPRSRAGNSVFKSGPLFISSKGIGWTSWKKRWFILTRTSLVFFRSDPSAIPQKGSEVNLTLGGIDLNNSGSVVVKADKKLLTVLFPDGRDGRAFTLKAETLEDLYGWKTALENALAQAPSAALVMGQNGIFRNDHTDAADGSWEQLKDRQPVKSLVIGRPILLALEDIDGAPSFLEKALRFIEEHGVKVEGILRQAADVDDVEHRVREYEQGKNEFSPDEDPHVIADCVKHVLRELPSSPVPASCCNALLEACRTDRGGRVNNMRAAICETFPEPNRRLLQRILTMMQTVASHKAENRMSSSAVAACMAPLLLRPLLAGDCDLENDFDVGGDGSVQLLQAAAAANHAQAIVITLLEEYDNIFGEGSMSPELYTDAEGSGSESEEASDDDESYEDDGHDDASFNSDATTDDEQESGGSCSDSAGTGDDDLHDDKGSEDSSSGSPKVAEDFEDDQKLSSSSPQTSLLQHDNVQKSEDLLDQNKNSSAVQANESAEAMGEISAEASSEHKLPGHGPDSCNKKSTAILSESMRSARRPTVWGRTSARKKLSMESIDYAIEDEAEIQRLEVAKTELQNRIAEEAKGNAILQENLEKRKEALHERRLALEQDVRRLQKQLQKERDLRTALESGLNMSRGPLPVSVTIDEKTKADLEEIALAEANVINLMQKVDDLGMQLNQQHEQNYGSVHDSGHQSQQTPNFQAKLKDKQRDNETMATSHLFERSTRSKDAYLDEAENENERKQDPPSLSCKLPQNQQLDQVHNSNSKSAGAPAISSAAEPVAVRPTAPSNSNKKSGEGANSTTSALTKLTTRLNFLKERRTQIANELQNMDKGRGSGQHAQKQEKGKGLEPHQSSLDSFQGSEVQSETGRGLEGCQTSLQNSDKELGKEGQSIQNSEKFRRSDGQLSLQNLEKGRRSEDQYVNRDKGR